MRIDRLAAALGCGLLVSSALATELPKDGMQALASDRDQASARAAAQTARAPYPEYFKRAYARYPSLPAGVLEALAYAETGWNHVKPDPATDPRDLHMPQSYGVMGLYHGGGFADQVGEGARLSGRSVRMVIDDPESNILAAAALLDRAIRTQTQGKALSGIEQAAPALERYAGFGPEAGNIDRYARQSFAYNVLLTMQKGVDEQGVRVPAQSLDLTRAFRAEQLARLRAPHLLIDASEDSVNVAPLSDDANAKAVDFGEAIWNPAASGNYSTATSTKTAVIMHTIEGTYAGGISWFKNPAAGVSAHYVVRKSDGQITQMVREAQTAWHAKNHNGYTIGIEHDGRAADPNNWSSAMVNASARLTKSICARRGVNCASAYNGPGHGTWHVLPDSVRIKGHGHLTGNSNRYDPGAYFPWSTYYTLINGGGGNPTPGKYWVDTFSDATGYKWPSTLTPTGTLRKGMNYVFCKAWGEEVRNGSSFNHWWLKTDLDVGPAGQWVSAYYLTRWGNDEAKDNSGRVIPDC